MSNDTTSKAILPIILSGGTGTRLWPVSRQNLPKQFHALGGDTPLLIQAAKRSEKPGLFHKPVVIANHQHRFMIADQLQSYGIAYDSIILEPDKKNTGPAIAAVSEYTKKTYGEETLLLVMPSDHIILDNQAFQEAVTKAAKAAEAGYIVCFGFKPQTAETEYGYIQTGKTLKEADTCKAVKAFKEKPDLKTAQDYLKTGEYVWNSGIFLFRADTMIKEIERYEPEIASAVKDSVENAHVDLDFLRLGKESFTQCKSISIDYAVMERTKKAAVLPVSFPWSDVGTFKKLWDIQEKDQGGNVISGRTFSRETSSCYLRSDGPLLATYGIEDLVVIAQRDVTLVATKSENGAIGTLVKALATEGHSEATHYDIDYRPWGSFRTIALGQRFHVKIIEVLPGKILSLQKHHHRAEHWIIVEGTAHIRRNEEQITLHENESIYIPIGAVHRLENPGKIPLKLIEIQTGSYLGEDDIVRLEDVYGREKQD